MWVDDRLGTYWRRKSSWWEVQVADGQWRRDVPDGPLRHMDSVERQPPVVTIPAPPGGSESLVELPKDTFIRLEGDSAYEVAVKHGFVGTEEQWLASLEGPPGPGSPFQLVTQEEYDALPTPRDPDMLYVIK